MKKWLPAAAFAFLLAAGSVPARAGLTIIPTFGPRIRQMRDASAIEASIDQAIATLDSYISNPITVKIFFGYSSTGLGSSLTATGNLAYSTYLSDLENNPNPSADDQTALASLPPGPNTGINNNSYVALSAALFTALGHPIKARALLAETGGFDSVIALNLGIMNISRSGPQNPNDYDLESVATHEMDEALGIGGDGSALYQPGNIEPANLPSTGIGPLDLYRYSAPGVRSFTYDPNATAYFSIDGGVKRLVAFNQDGAGGADFGDWASAKPQVQDAFGTPGTAPNIGPNELIALDVVGYTLTTSGLSTEAVTPAIVTAQDIPFQSIPEPQPVLSILLAFTFLPIIRGPYFKSLCKKIAVPTIRQVTSSPIR